VVAEWSRPAYLFRLARGRISDTEVYATKAFWVAIITGFLIQCYKGFTEYHRTGHWNLRRFVETGGMPSSHAASVAALSTSVGIQQGFGSLLFGVTLYFSLVVMYDAAGLRRAAGRQAVILNRLIEEHFKNPEKGTQKLMELLGHTPLEVLVGAVLGVASALLWHWIL
jgi:acid phosphatase family membrane protein YuiD